MNTKGMVVTERTENNPWMTVTLMPEFFPQRPAAHPTIYAYEDTNPQYAGLLKVGYTAIDVDKRVAQQYPTKRPDGSVPYRIVYRESAMYPDGNSFTDRDVHKVLKRKKIPGMGGEWFRCTMDDVRLRTASTAARTSSTVQRNHSPPMPGIFLRFNTLCTSRSVKELPSGYMADSR